LLEKMIKLESPHWRSHRALYGWLLFTVSSSGRLFQTFLELVSQFHFQPKKRHFSSCDLELWAMIMSFGSYRSNIRALRHTQTPNRLSTWPQNGP